MCDRPCRHAVGCCGINALDNNGQTVPAEPAHNQSVSDGDAGPSQTIPDEDSGTRQTVSDEDPSHNQTVADEDLGRSQTVPDEGPCIRQKVSDEDPSHNQTVADEDSGRRQSESDEDHSSIHEDHSPSQTVSNEESCPIQMVSDETHGPSQTISDGDHGSSQTVSDEDNGSSQTVLYEDYCPSQVVSDEDHSPSQIVSDEDYGPIHTVSGKNHHPSQTISYEDHDHSQEVSDEDHSPSQTVSDENYGPSQALSDENHGPSQSVSDEGHRPSQIVSDVGHSPTQTISDEDHGASQTVSNKGHGSSQTVSDVGHGPSQTASDNDPTPSQTVSDDHGPSQAVADENLGPDQMVSDEDLRPSQTVSDKDLGSCHIVSGVDHSASQTVSDEDHDPSQTVSDDHGSSQMVSDKDPSSSQTVSDEDRGPRQTASDEDHCSSQTVSDDDYGPNRTKSDDRGHSQTVSDEEYGSRQTVSDEDRGPSQTASNEDHDPSQVVSDEDHSPSQIISDEDSSPIQMVSDEDPNRSQAESYEGNGSRQTVSDEHPCPDQTVSDEDHDLNQTVSDEDPGPSQTVSEEYPVPDQTELDEDLGLHQTVSKVDLGPDQTVSDEDHSPSQIVLDEDRGPSQRVSDEDLDPSQMAAGENHGPDQMASDEDPDTSQTVSNTNLVLVQKVSNEDISPSQTVSDKDPGLDEIVLEEDPSISQTVLEENLGPCQTVSEDPGPSQMIPGEDPCSSQTESDMDSDPRRTVLNKNPSLNQMVSDEDSGPRQTVSDKNFDPSQMIPDEDPSIINTSRGGSSDDSSSPNSRNSSGGSSCSASSDGIGINMAASSAGGSGVRFVVFVHVGNRRVIPAEPQVFVTLMDSVGRATEPHQLSGLTSTAVEAGTVFSYTLPDEGQLSDVDSVELRCDFPDTDDLPPKKMTMAKDAQKRGSSKSLCDETDSLLGTMSSDDQQKRCGSGARRDAANALLEEALLKPVDRQKLTDSDTDSCGRCTVSLSSEGRKERLSSAGWYVRAGSVFVELVTVVDRRTGRRAVFPLHRWLSGRLYRVRQYDMSLPHQDDGPLTVTLRRAELVHKRITYHYRQPPCDGQITMQDMPEEEKFPDICPEEEKSPALCESFGRALFDLQQNTASLGATADKWSSFAELTKTVRSTLGETDAMAHWNTDRWFGIQRLQGVNAKLITLCTAIPDKLGVSASMLEPFLENFTLQEVIQCNKVFIVDLHMLEGIEAVEGTELCCPIAIFYLDKTGEFMPIAIQLFQQKGVDNPVFLPSDPVNVWLLAKMYYNNAEAQHHQIVTHLGVPHLLMEGVAVSVHRCLSPSHPLHRLLAPHLVRQLAASERVWRELLSAGGWLDRCGTVSGRGRLQLISRSLQSWRLDTCGVIPREVASRGVDSRRVLPYYPYRDDACALYAAIENYVRAVVGSAYGNGVHLRRDFELLQWRRELGRSRDQGGVGLLGLPGDVQTGFSSVDQLVEVVTALIATCTVGRAAASYGQYDQYGLVSNYPLRLYGRAPRSKELEPSEENLMQYLPGRDVTREILVYTKLLTQRGTKSLGDFEMRYLYDPVSSLAAEDFRAELLELGSNISDRNSVAKFPYKWLDPTGMTNSAGSWQAVWDE